MAAHKPNQWPEAIHCALESGGELCQFRVVQEKADCLVQIGTEWLWGIKLPEIEDGGTNFVLTDKGASEKHRRVYKIFPNAIVIVIPEVEPAEETIDTTFSEVTREETFRYNGYLCMVSWEEDDDFAAVVIEGGLKGFRLHPVADSVVQKIVRKTKVPEADVPTSDSAGPDAPFNC